mmetsp:Transcript_73031/g.138083  ORF Transcript_73031/g.138083 Transcript_73031/m.138083 type:complete len:87 (+) Transcript_73031:215-475(+)
MAGMPSLRRHFSEHGLHALQISRANAHRRRDVRPDHLIPCHRGKQDGLLLDAPISIVAVVAVTMPMLDAPILIVAAVAGVCACMKE